MSVQSVKPTRREQRRDQLLDCALDLFGEVGLERATIKSLAARAGISQGLLYHYFQSKEELIAAVMERESLVPQLEALYASLEALPVREGLRRLTLETWRLFWEKKDSCWLFFREIRNPSVAAPMEGMRLENLRLLARYLESRVEAGELRPHDCGVTARILLSAIFVLTVIPPGPLESPTESTLSVMVDLLLQGTLNS